jgi:hypothetical protein
MKRRKFLNHSALAITAYSLSTRKAVAEPSILMRKMLENSSEQLMDWQPLTKGPGFHWFSYYDIQQFEPTGRYVLGMQVSFEGRQPTADDEVKIGIIDLQDGNRWKQVGTSKAWCWQQGCRLQWRPKSDREILWNDREDGKLVCRILDVKSGAMRTIPSPVDHIHPDGKVAIVADFARVGWMRPDYGYQGIPDPNRKVHAPSDSGIWKVDIDRGERRMLLSLAEIAAFPSEGYSPEKKGFHYTNHLSWSPSGKSIMFLHRGDVAARMLIADADGSNLRFITNNPSHYAWENDDRMLCWVPPSYRYYQTDGKGDSKGVSLFPAPNGHQTFIPGTDWLLTDTYPEAGPGADRVQYIYLYHLKTGKKVIIGKFHSPVEYSGMWRCDTHPRLSPDFTKVTIDATHSSGRQIYMTDISSVIGKR